MTLRKLKVYPCLYDNYAPRILLQGKWLLNANFNIGDRIKINISKNKLFIRKIESCE
ncbi:MAG: hypothetical protein ACD_79C01515G0002 [uncultured bacterium]|nr:MAG: hypothetical protein ACD_79C01515G0002 [uncultured bacterium]